jgi:hypothetical protein
LRKPKKTKKNKDFSNYGGPCLGQAGAPGLAGWLGWAAGLAGWLWVPILIPMVAEIFVFLSILGCLNGFAVV